MNPLFGRDHEVSVAVARLEATRQGVGQLLLISGEPGIGKSRLAQEVEALARGRSFAVATGRCWEVGGAPAFWPWREALGEEFAALIDDTSFQGGGLEQRFVFFERATRFLKSLPAQGPMLLVLDDMHAADLPSLHLLLFAARSLRSCPLMIVATMRVVESQETEERAQLFQKLGREATTLQLSRLPMGEVAEWARQSGEGDSEALFALTEGNPLFVTEVLRVGIENASAPNGLAGVLDTHLTRLSPGPRAVLECAAVLGRKVERTQLMALADEAPDDVEAAIRESVRLGLVVEPSPSTISFAHVLLRDALFQQTPPSRRALLHWRAASMLEARGADATTVAEHRLAGAPAGDEELAVTAALDAARLALSKLAFETAVSLAERVLPLPATNHRPELRLSALLVLADALVRGGASQRARPVADEAGRLARELGANEAVVEAALLHASELTSGARNADMVERLSVARDLVPDTAPALKAKVLARLASAKMPAQDEVEADEVREMAATAEALASGLDDRTRLFVLQFVSSARGYFGDADERLARSSEMVALARKLHETMAFATAGVWNTGVIAEVGRRDAAEALVDEIEEMLGALPDDFHRFRVFACRASLAAFRGALEESEHWGDKLIRHTEPREDITGRVTWSLHRISLTILDGRHEERASDLEQASQWLARIPTLGAFSAWIHARFGREQEARRSLGDITAPRLLESFPALSITGDVAVLLNAMDLAEPVYEALSAMRTTQRFFWGPVGGSVFGPTPLVLARLARMLGRLDDARTLLDEADAMCERAQSPPFKALVADERERMGMRPAPSPPRPARGVDELRLERDGDTWVFSRGDGPGLRLNHGKGLEYLKTLLENPGTEIYVLRLVGAEFAPGDAGEVIDRDAQRAYRERLVDLQEELDEAERFSDFARKEKARAELEAIAEQLAGAVGLGGRSRKAASDVQRARINVQRRLKDAIARIAEHDEALGAYLKATIQTGTYCAYRPI